MSDTQSRRSSRSVCRCARRGRTLGKFLDNGCAGRATWEQFASPWRFVTFLSSTVNGYSGRVLVRSYVHVRLRSCPVTPKTPHGISEFVAEFRVSSFNGRVYSFLMAIFLFSFLNHELLISIVLYYCCEAACFCLFETILNCEEIINSQIEEITIIVYHQRS